MSEIALGWEWRADRDGMIGGADVGAEPIGVGINRDRLESFLVAGADDAQGDLAPIGDQNTFHGNERQLTDRRRRAGGLRAG